MKNNIFLKSKKRQEAFFFLLCRCFDQGQIVLPLVRVDDGAAADDEEAAANFGLEVERAQKL